MNTMLQLSGFRQKKKITRLSIEPWQPRNTGCNEFYCNTQPATADWVQHNLRAPFTSSDSATGFNTTVRAHLHPATADWVQHNLRAHLHPATADRCSTQPKSPFTSQRQRCIWRCCSQNGSQSDSPATSQRCRSH